MSNAILPSEASGEAPLRGLIMLTELPGVGERTAGRVLRLARERGLEITQVLALPAADLAADFRLPGIAAERLRAQWDRHEEHCRRLWHRLCDSAVTVSEPGDAAYPERWYKRCGPPPPIVYSYGNAEVLASRTLAVLTSRTLDERTVAATVQVVRQAASEAYTLVSGGMKATHRIAAVTVKAAGASRVVVLDRGLFATFGQDLRSDPFGFGPGRAALDIHKTLVLSTFRPYDHAAPANGRRRDRLVAELADVVVAVKARPGGEIERVCLRALDRGQCVLSWHGENAGLVAAGAVPIDESNIQGGFRRFL